MCNTTVEKLTYIMYLVLSRYILQIMSSFGYFQWVEKYVSCNSDKNVYILDKFGLYPVLAYMCCGDHRFKE